MSFLIRNSVNRSILCLLKTNFPSTSYCCLEKSVKNLKLQRSDSREVEKSNRKEQSRQQEDNDDDDEADDVQDDFEELSTDKQIRLVKTSVNSMRADLLLKAGLGIARNKVEALFYESKIRVNGKKLLKKSVHLDVGDEIDVVRGVSPTNPDHLIVSRVEIVAANPKTESISVSLRRQKTLIIEDYETDTVISDK